MDVRPDGQERAGHRVKSVSKDRPPLCVARLLEGAEAGRVGWIMALPPSLDLEIQAIQQVGSASMETPCIPVQTLTLARAAPRHRLPFSSFLCLSPSPENSKAMFLNIISHQSLVPSPISSIPVPYLSTFPLIVLFQPHTRALFHLCPAWAPTFLWPSKVHIQLLLPGAGCSQCWPLQSSEWNVAVGRGGDGV